MLARLGVLLLLFEVGLESTVGADAQGRRLVAARRDARRRRAVRARLGRRRLAAARAERVRARLPRRDADARPASASPRACSRISAARSAREARIILGAAVIDDVLGLVILAVVSGVIGAADRGGATLARRGRASSSCKAVAFLVGSLVARRRALAAPVPLAVAAAARAACCSRPGWRSASCWPGSPTRSASRRSSARSPPG